MDNSDVQLVGGPCGQHGPYTFYKAFKYMKNGVKRVVTLSEFFFVKLWIDSDLLCIGELQLLWIDKNSEQVLASLRLYFLPENTPEGRMDHGEDEVLAISEKVVLRVEDLITWITVDAEWTWGRLGKYEKDIKEPKSEECKPTKVLTENSLDFSDIDKERKDCQQECEGPSVVILSYPRYCRYRAMMKRLENVENDYLKFKIVTALGGFTVTSRNTRVLFCKDTFDYPELEGHELLCNHLAPKLKGRPRGKRKKRSVSPGSESNESESSVSNTFNGTKPTPEPGSSGVNGSGADTTTSLRRSTRSQENSESKEFFKKLCSFMKSNQTPIGRVPSLGYKEIDLHGFYTKVQKLGGYDSVTANRLWKSIFDEMSGHQNSTSAATVIRRHYERFLLPYERHVKGEEYKPLPISERRRLKSKAGSSASDAETSEGASSRSGNSTPVPQLVSPSTPTTSPDNKEHNQNKSPENNKTSSSLRSVRVKPERKEKNEPTNNNNNNNNNNSSTNNNNQETEIKNEVPDVAPTDTSTTSTPSPPPPPSSTDTVASTKSLGEMITDMKREPLTTHRNETTTPLSLPPPPPPPSQPQTPTTPTDKNAEPVTSAVAPVVAPNPPDKSLSPVEGKENVPVIRTGDTVADKIGDIIEVPYKPKTPPDVVDLESDAYKSITANLQKPFLHEVKKRKLEILKEGGLEVTPVRSYVAPPPPPSPHKDGVRPSVIQPTGAKVARIEMPPPAANHVPLKRLNFAKVPSVPKSVGGAVGGVHVNGTLPPPKLHQSKSIYSYSERTVYGDPKDCIAPPTPIYHANYGPKPDGILDLTTKSRQKPVVEIMRVPNSMQPLNLRDGVVKSAHVPPPPKAPTLLDGRRLGSNLEITLVGPQPKLAQPPPLPPPAPQPHHQQQAQHHQPHSHPHQRHHYPPPAPIKRAPNDAYGIQKMARLDDSNGRYHKSVSKELSIPHLYRKEMKVAPPPPPPPTAQQKAPYPAPHFPYFSQLYDGGNKGSGVTPPPPPPYLPIFDPMYYSAAVQNLYTHGALNTTQPMMPFPSTEQLKFYSDLMAHSSRLNFPFQLPQDNAAATPTNHFKKP